MPVPKVNYCQHPHCHTRIGLLGTHCDEHASSRIEGAVCTHRQCESIGTRTVEMLDAELEVKTATWACESCAAELEAENEKLRQEYIHPTQRHGAHPIVRRPYVNRQRRR